MIEDGRGKNIQFLKDIQDTYFIITDQGIVEDTCDFTQLVIVIRVCLPDKFFRQIQGKA